MKSMNQKYVDKAIFDNQVIYDYYFRRLLQITMSTFKWHDLPDTCNARYMEEMLARNGYVLFFRDDIVDKYLCLPCTLSGTFDYNNEATERRAYAPNGYQFDANPENSVVIYNNMLKLNGLSEIEIYARDLANLHQTININIHQQKTPLIIKCNQSQLLTMKNLYMKYEGNIPVIFGDESLNVDSVEVLNTNAPFVADNLYNLLVLKWNEYLTYLGVDNIQTQKKERMITDEVNTAMGAINVNRETRLRMREKACDEINEKFGLNISVEFIGDAVGDMPDYDTVSNEGGSQHE